MGRFYTTEHSTTSYEAAGIDWRARHAAALAIEGEDAPRTVRFSDEEGYEVEITPETGGIVFNATEDDLDCFWVLDTRDDTKWVRFRDETDPEEWDGIEETLRYAGSTILTHYPQPWAAELWMNRRQADLSCADTMPEGWDAAPNAQ